MRVGSNLYKLQIGGAGGAAPAATAAAPPKAAPAPAKAAPAPAAAAAATAAPAKPASVATKASEPAATTANNTTSAVSAPSVAVAGGSSDARGERRVKMKKIRARIADRLKDSQNTYAMLTTFNEIDMSALIALRTEYKDLFEKKHGVKLGFMSMFVKAASEALLTQPVVNAVIDGGDIVYRDYVDVSVAVASPNGLVVPVLVRQCVFVVVF